MAHDIHDAFVKKIFEQPENAAGLLAEVLPPELAEIIDFGTLALQSGSFVDSDLAKRYSDLLFSARTKRGDEVLIYLLIEHQRTPYRLLPLRALVYEVRILSRWLADHPKATELPPVFTVVLQQHRSTATPALLSSLFAHADVLPPASRRYLPDLELIVLDLPNEDDHVLLQRGMPDAAKLGLLVLKHAPHSEDFLARFRRWMHVVRSLVQHPSGPDALRVLLRYIDEVSEHVKLAEIEQLIAVEIGSPGATTMATIAQTLREEGRIEERRSTLLRLLTLRFGALPIEVVDRIRSAAGEQLLAWTDRFVTAQTIQQVFDR
ncbi:MAG: Rpn family recombination-promoting nuclease/putative transposase [Planctomycetota bacterium]